MDALKSSIFISLEGLSGVGKSEVATIVANAVQGEFYHLTTDFASAKSLMQKAEDVDSRMCLFVSAMLYSSVRIEDKLKNGTSIVVDGFVARTLAYHQGMGAKISIDARQAIRFPDFSIMLICEEQERRRRIALRDRPKSIWDEIELANIAKIRSLYEANGFPTIETTGKTKEAVADEILRHCGMPALINTP